MGWGKYAPITSLAVCVNPGSGFNCYWEMPFRKKAQDHAWRTWTTRTMTLYYQIDYTLTDVPRRRGLLPCPVPPREPAALQAGLHDPRRRQGLGPLRRHVPGLGRRTTTAGGARARSSSTWTATRNFPTICGTGTEDYFCGSYNFENQDKKQYQAFTTPYSGLTQVIQPDGLYQSQQRFGLYRWHIMDPVRFENDLRVTIQALGWRSGRRYLPLQDDIASVAFWYQTEPHAAFPKLPSKDQLEVN